METVKQYRFRAPHEHGAWWTFFSCLAAGLIQALAWRVNPLTAISLALGMACFFVASDWITDLAIAALKKGARASQALGSARGWSISLGGALLIAWALARAEASRHGLGVELGQALAAWGLAIAVVLLLRVNLHERSLALLMPSAVLLTAPLMLLGALAFGGLGAKAAGYWALWAWFFGAGILFVQTWVRGAMLPRWRLYVAALPYLAQGLVLAYFSRWPGVIVLVIFSLRVLWRLQDRLRAWNAQRAELKGGPAPLRLPTDGVEIRKLGWEQVAWSLVLSVIWTWRYWP